MRAAVLDYDGLTYDEERYSSPIKDSLTEGHLQRVADRLEADDSLYESL